MLKIKRRSINIIVILMSFIFLNCVSISTKAAGNESNNIIVKPAYKDFGRIGNNDPFSFTITVTNNDDANTFLANVEGKGKEFISFEPESFDLQKGESKEVKVKVDNGDKFPASSYDYSITFSAKNNNKDWVSSSTSNSLRLVFIKEGISLASVNVKDINKPEQANFHLIFANFNSKEENINSSVSIIYKDDNSEVTKFNENIKMQPYPSGGFYGTMKFNWDSKDAKMGDYIVKYKAIKSDGGVIEGEQPFAVGEMKGELESVNIKDTYQGKPVKISAKVKNTGNLTLPVTFDISIKNSNGEEVFKEQKQDNINASEEKTLESEWDTTNAKVGEYTVDYTVKIGDQTQSNTVYFKILGSYMLYVAIVSIIVILLIILVIIAKRKKKISEKD